MPAATMNNKPGRGRFIMRQTYTLAGPYTYLRDLQALERARMPGPRGPLPELQGISSPLTGHLLHWRRALAAHPDRAFAMYVLNGIEHDFRVGFAHGSPLTPTLHNMHPAALHPEAIDSYIGTETQEGRMLGPFPPGRIRGLHINRMGVVPKGHTPGRWRLITDLSHPEGNSVNDGIHSHLCSLK